MSTGGGKMVEGSGGGCPAWLPGKKPILATLVVAALAGVVLLSGYTDVGQSFVVGPLSSGHKLVSEALRSRFSGAAPPVWCTSGKNISHSINASAVCQKIATEPQGQQNRSEEPPQEPQNKQQDKKEQPQQLQNKQQSPQEQPQQKPSTTASQRPPEGYGKTYVTYDNTTVIQCPLNSPFVMCGGKPPPRTAAEQAADAGRHRPYRIAQVRSASWAPKMDFSKCRYNNCVSVGNKVGPEVDLVHVYGVGLSARIPRPRRYSNESWSFGAWESPYHTHADLLSNEKSPWNNEFGFTISYRTDSDVFVPYGYLAFEPTPLDKRPNYYEIAKGKTKSVAWFVSNCRTPSKRLEYVRKLKNYIDVDIYGACGLPCAKKNGKCWEDLPVHYKFYLSFENSICTDYISEKLYKIYTSGMHVIPVTRGGTDYSRYFPQNTFIDAGKFASPRELAEHLKSLGSDVQTYARMLEHKDQYRWFGGLGSMWCNLCEVLNTKGLRSKAYNMKRWWGDGKCRNPTDIR